MLDFSQRPELEVYASIVAAVEAGAASVGIPVLIAGAFARDLHLLYRHAIDTERQTEDVDFALALPHWDAFQQLKEHLIVSHAFRATADPLRLRHVSDLPIDLVPFGRAGCSSRYWAVSWKMGCRPGADLL